MIKSIKNILFWILYLLNIIFGLFPIYYLQEQNIVYVLISCFFVASIYVFLITKNGILGKVSYVTFILFLLSIGTSFEGNSAGKFVSIESERMFLLISGSLSLFALIFFSYLVKIKEGFEKKTSLFMIVCIVLFLLLFGMSVPNFHSNFVYTRVPIGALLVFSILRRKKKIFLVGGIIISIIALVLSASLFAAETYNIQGKEKEAVLSFMEPKVQNMFQSYNQRDLDSFIKDFSQELKLMVVQDVQNINARRDKDGKYMSSEDSTVTFYAGFYHVLYSVYFEKVEGPMYYDFWLSGIKPDNTIYGFRVFQD